MSDLQEDIITYFTTNGLVAGLAKDSFIDSWPDTPNSVVIVNEYGSLGTPPQLDCSHRSIQIVVRDPSAVVAKQLACSLHAALRTEDGYVDLTNTRWAMIYLRGVPDKLKEDAQGRIYYYFNLGVTTSYDDQ